MSQSKTPGKSHVLALCGGVGGAKLALGLSRVLAPEDLTIIVNTGDDFEHLGFAISPDIDTVVYTLSGLANQTLGWGLEGDTRQFLETLGKLGGETWFQLGDRDLAMHAVRTQRLAAGESLSDITRDLARRLGIAPLIAPMSDQPVRTWIDTDEGPLAFQHYFVRELCKPVARGLRYEGAERARPSPAFAGALAREDLAAIVICPSNPYLSIDPILAIPGVADAIRTRKAPCIAVSPIVGGLAIKGPTAKLMTELGVAPSVLAVAEHYRGLIDGLVIDAGDAGEAAGVEALGIATLVTPTVMRTLEDRVALAREMVGFRGKIGTPHKR